MYFVGAGMVLGVAVTGEMCHICKPNHQQASLVLEEIRANHTHLHCAQEHLCLSHRYFCRQLGWFHSVGHILTEVRAEGSLRGHLFPCFSTALASDAVLIDGFCPSFGPDTVELGLQQGDQGKLSSPLLSFGEATAENIQSRICGSRGKKGLRHVLQGAMRRAELV